jgi:hypothetical protein
MISGVDEEGALITDTFFWAPMVQGSAGTFAGDTDVNFSSPAEGQVPLYDAGTSKWVNR